MSEATDLAGSVASGLTSGPLGAVAAIGSVASDIIGKFVTDPTQKLAAQQHSLDLQAQLQLAALDAETKDVQASAGANNDHYLGGLRATFGYAMTGLYVWNYAICRFFKQQPVDIPMNLNLIFATLMLGFIGVPAGIEAMKQVMGMPGDSQVSAFGIKVGNKS